MAEEESLKVAVRVRPFNRREKERNATVIVEMKGPTTIITDPNSSEEPREFNFDYSYWSHDGCKEEANGFFSQDPKHPNGKQYADQKCVYDDLGAGVLDNAWGGYNSTLFAYGQTGSGKSWSIVGYGSNKGIVPQFCEQLFIGIDKKKAAADGTEYEVTFSMLEIYNEQVRDLLDSSPKRRSGLRVRQHPKRGFYAEALKVAPVGSYKEIASKMEEGTMNRTVAATNMNATSSRAHTIVGITFVQKFKNSAGEETAKSAQINLVDLAGSERADATGATGDRLKEGAAINQSLSSLGNCIAALADKSQGKNVRVPFRDSVLTKLLKNALGGNSKTIMVAAISPADINYEESLSTLRYADRAKQIKTKVSVNEDPTDKLIRELQEENEKLKEIMASGNLAIIKGDDEDDDDISDKEKAQIREELEEEYESLLQKNQQEMEEMKKTFEERLSEAQTSVVAEGGAAEILEKRKKVAHISNLNLDPMLSGYIVYFIDAPETTIGRKKPESTVAIQLVGPSIADTHAIIRETSGKYSIESGATNLRVLRNGKTVTSQTDLKHNDRLLLGTTQYFVFVNPAERDASKTSFAEVTFETAQEEIARKSGFDMSAENKSRDEALLKEDMLELMPAVEEANAISEELDKKMKFELMIVSPEARGEAKGRPEVMIHVTNLETKHDWMWLRQKFFNRKYVMQEMYQNYQEGEDWDLPADRDPFDEDYEAESHIGSVKVWMQSLAYRIEMKQQLEITDYKGQSVGLLNVEVEPCDKKGKPFADKDAMFIEDPQEQIGQDVNILVKLVSARGLPNRFTHVYAKYNVYLDEEMTTTKPIENTRNPDWNHSKKFLLAPSTEQLIDYLKDGAIIVQIWGKQKAPKNKRSINTKDAMLSAAMTKGQISAANTNTKTCDGEKVKYMMEVSLLQKRQEKMERRLKCFKDLVALLEREKKRRIPTSIVINLYNSKSADEAEKCLQLASADKDESCSSDDDSDNSHDGDEKKEKTKIKKRSGTQKQRNHGKPNQQSSSCRLL